VEDSKIVFRLDDVMKKGAAVTRRGGRRLSFIVYVPRARAGQQIVMLNESNREIETYHADGVYMPHREESGSDLFTQGEVQR